MLGSNRNSAIIINYEMSLAKLIPDKFGKSNKLSLVASKL